MQISIIDFILLSVIALIVMLYAYYRYRVEKHKEEKLLIPKLESYKEKFLEERENFIKKSQELKDKMEEVKREIENLKNKYQEYPWTESQIKYLKTMKGSEFEYYLTTAFQMLGFIAIALPFYKDHSLRVFHNFCKFVFPCHPEAEGRRISFLSFDLKRKIGDSSHALRITVWIFGTASTTTLT